MEIKMNNFHVPAFPINENDESIAHLGVTKAEHVALTLLAGQLMPKKKIAKQKKIEECFRYAALFLLEAETFKKATSNTKEET